MKAPKEIRRWVAKRRRSDSKKNGVVSWLFDAPKVEVKLAKNKRLYKRNSTEVDWSKANRTMS